MRSLESLAKAKYAEHMRCKMKGFDCIWSDTELLKALLLWVDE
jgi:hypothetical protein